MTQEVSNYTNNLKMHLELRRKDLDIMLTSSMPLQFSHMKTLLWLNLLIIGLILNFTQHLNLSDLIVTTLLFAVLAIVVVMTAWLTNRDRSYGSPSEPDLMSRYEDNDWTQAKATLDMIGLVDSSIKENAKVLTNRGKLMHLSAISTLCAIISLALALPISPPNL